MTDVGLIASDANDLSRIQTQDVALFIMGKFKEAILIMNEGN